MAFYVQRLIINGSTVGAVNSVLATFDFTTALPGGGNLDNAAVIFIARCTVNSVGAGLANHISRSATVKRISGVISIPGQHDEISGANGLATFVYGLNGNQIQFIAIGQTANTVVYYGTIEIYITQ